MKNTLYRLILLCSASAQTVLALYIVLADERSSAINIDLPIVVCTALVTWVHLCVVISPGVLNYIGQPIWATSASAVDVDSMHSAGVTAWPDSRAPQWETVYSGIRDGVMLSSVEGKIVYANHSMVRMLGYSVGELTQIQSASSIIHPEDAAYAQQLLEQHSQGNTTTGELRLIHKEGYTIHVASHSVPVLNDNNRLTQVFSVMRDVKAQPHSETALQQSEERYRAIVELSPVGVVVHNGEEILYVNASGARISGMETPEQLIGTGLSSFVSEQDREDIAKNLAHVLRTGEEIGTFERPC